MAKALIQKVRITGFTKHYSVLMQSLHESGSLQIIEDNNLSGASATRSTEHVGAFDLAQVDFAIRFLSKYAPTTSKIESLLSGGKLVMTEVDAKKRLKAFESECVEIVARCQALEDTMVRSRNEKAKIPAQLELLDILSDFDGTVQSDYSTKTTTSVVGVLDKVEWKNFSSETAQASNLIDLVRIGKTAKQVYFRLTFMHSIKEEVDGILAGYNWESLDLASHFGAGDQTLDVVKKDLLAAEEQYETKIKNAEAEALVLSEKIEDLKVFYDYHSWTKEKNDQKSSMYTTEKIFAFHAWIFSDTVEKTEDWLKKAFVGEVSMELIEVEEGEEAPVALRNKWGVRSFEPVSDMYGLPKSTEFDPTPFLAPFFFVFFGLCLSDTGYGSILLLVSSWFLIFGKFGEKAKDALFLLLFCGFSAFCGGIILGGHFGLTPEQAPLLVNESTGKFYGQLIEPMVGSGPIIFLSLALGLGALHLLFGLMVSFAQTWMNGRKADAFMDSGTWMFFLIALSGFGLSSQLNLDKDLMANLAMLGAGLLVVTQGRDQKNWFLKPIFGLLALYNVTSYLSDLLSYSRIMALGLATGVVGFAMNMTAGILGAMMPHWTLALLLSVIVILFGHILNFSLALLGAFIHSGRLQFIEFFGKFYEGGGTKFEPFKREGKYLFFKN